MDEQSRNHIESKFGQRAVCASCRHAIVFLNQSGTIEFVYCLLQKSHPGAEDTCNRWGKAYAMMVHTLPIPPGGSVSGHPSSG